jgi:DNA-directed RNA polymerase specialized sigma24 family protein
MLAFSVFPRDDSQHQFCAMVAAFLDCCLRLGVKQRLPNAMPPAAIQRLGEAPMTSEGSVSGWLGQLQAGAPEAAEQLWQRYFVRLVELARLKLHGMARRVADEEDVALSVFDRFCRGVEEGRFPNLEDRHNLWRLLVVLTAHKVSNLRRAQKRQKRGGRTEGQTAPNCDDSELDQVIGREPSPEFAAEVADACESLLAALGSDMLRSIAQAKMEGFTTEEIANNLHYCQRTVERKLNLIRTIWEKEGKP